MSTLFTPVIFRDHRLSLSHFVATAGIMASLAMILVSWDQRPIDLPRFHNTNHSATTGQTYYTSDAGRGFIRPISYGSAVPASAQPGSRHLVSSVVGYSHGNNQ